MKVALFISSLSIQGCFRDYEFLFKYCTSRNEVVLQIPSTQVSCLRIAPTGYLTELHWAQHGTSALGPRLFRCVSRRSLTLPSHLHDRSDTMSSIQDENARHDFEDIYSAATLTVTTGVLTRLTELERPVSANHI